MIFRTYTLTFLMVASALLICSGCSGDDDDQKTEETPTPVAPHNDWFRLSSLELQDSGSGVDLDGDGDIDNSLPSALDTINEVIYAVVEAALADSTLPETCNSEEPVCQQLILDQLQNLLDTMLSVDSLNGGIEQAITSGEDGYLLFFDGYNDSVTLTWYSVAGEGETPVELTYQQGSLSATGSGTFGPSELVLSAEYDAPGPDPAVELSFTLYNWLTEIDGYDAENQLAFDTGAAIAVDDLLEIVSDILDLVNEILVQGGQEPVDKEAVMATVSDELYALADVDVSGDGDMDAISFAATGDADVEAVAE